MPGQPMVIGPFIRGLNNISTAGESEDTEVVDLINMEVSLDRSLESRPPFLVERNTVLTNSTYKHKIYGTHFVSETEWYLIVLTPYDVGSAQIRAYRNGDLTDYVAIHTVTATQSHNVPAQMVQFKDASYFIMPPESTEPGFSWSSTVAKTNIPQMPKGKILISWKNRLWAAGSPNSSTDGDRVWFSTVDAVGLHPDKWEATNFFDTAPGEGGYVTALVPFFNNLMIFKNDGTWRFSYSASPSGGLVEKISGTVGAANSECVVEFENLIYCYDQGTVYELVNSSFNPINMKIKFKPDDESDFEEPSSVTLSKINRRLVIRYRNSIYVYSAETKAWAQWRSSRALPYRFYEIPGDSSLAKSSQFVAAQEASTYRSLVIPYDRFSPSLEVGSTGTILGGPREVLISALSEESEILIDHSLVSVGPGQQISFSANLEILSFESASLVINMYSADNIKTVKEFPLTGTQISVVEPVANDAVYATISVKAKPLPNSSDNHLRLTSIIVSKVGGPVPSLLTRFIYEHSDSPVPQEIINTSVTTKVYDFGQPSVFKRLFLWGIDVKTLNRISAITRISAKSRNLTFGELTEYTHAELSTGTWGTPLMLENASVRVVDTTEPIAEETESNRFFIKLIKGLRFRQLSFNIQMSTDGTLETGPAKLYTITAFVAAKQMVVDKTS